MRVSPLRKLQEAAGASLVPYGPPEADVLMVETFGELELEYAALRKGCILIDQPHRGVVEITGADRLPFLNRMLTQELKGFEPGQVPRSFWLNRKGRIDADLRLIELGSRTLLELDIHAVERAMKGLSEFIITEDVQMTDLSGSIHRLGLHGPTAGALLAEVAKPTSGPAALDLKNDSSCTLRVGPHELVVARDDTTGDPGFELFVPAAETEALYQLLLQTGHGHAAGGPASRINLRPAGWHAYNIGRIEGGTPLYNIDFGPDSLPHETGILHDRVNFKKGCYLGQEIVARMESRGHSKRTLVGLRCDVPDPTTAAHDRPQSSTGGQVWRADAPEGEPVGVVTSSTLSPMLEWSPICFAAVKPDVRAAQTRLQVAADDDRVAATVQPSLKFWSRP